MMRLKERIDIDIKEALKARKKEKLEALKSVKAAILIAETEKGSSGTLSEEQELKIIQKLLKQRKESADIYISQNRKDLADVELFQFECIENYLPAMMDEPTLKIEIQKIINNLGVSDPKDFGKVMGVASKQFSGKADNKMVSDIIRSLLA